jgi:hypothetical protein
VRFSGANKFVVFATASHAHDGGPNGKKLAEITFRPVHGDLHPFTSGGHIEGSYLRESNKPGAPAHDPYPLQLTPQANGSYVATITVGRSGAYDFDLKLSDENESDGHHVTLQIQF